MSVTSRQHWAAGAALTCLSLFLAMGLFFGCGRPQWNVLIITMDTTRADALRCYGNEFIETPALNRLAREGVLFEHAYSLVPLTLPAHASIMSGMAPMSHGVIDNGAYHVPNEIVTLAEVLKEKGYETAAFISAKVLDRSFNLDQGFDLYNQDDINPQENDEDSILVADRKGNKTTDAALAWLQSHRHKPYFLWVHYYDPHAAYVPPPPYDTLYASRYLGEIAFMDSQIKRLLEDLREKGDCDHTIVIAVADHGEGLGEHSEPTHSNFLYNTTQHIPLIVRVPGLKEPGRRIKTPASQVDVMPTILAFLRIEPPAQVEGESLVSLIQNGDEGGEEEKFAFLETKANFLHYGWSPLSGIVGVRYKYIKAPKPEFYDLQTDPAELKNLYTPENKLALQLRSRLDRMEKGFERLIIGAQEAEVTPQMQRQLEALGYVVRGAHGNPKIAAGKNPLDFVDLLPAFMSMNRAIKRGDYPELLELTAKVLARDPENPFGIYRRAGALFGVGRFDEALAEYALFFKLHEDTYDGYTQVGNIYVRMSQEAKFRGDIPAARDYLQKAKTAYTKACTLARRNTEAEYFLGRIALELGNFEEAFKQFQAENLVNTEWGHLGMAKYYELQGRPGLAEAEYDQVSKLSGERSVVYWQEFAQFLNSQNRGAEAFDFLQKAVKEDPSLNTDSGFRRALETARQAKGAAAPGAEAAPGGTVAPGNGAGPAVVPGLSVSPAATPGGAAAPGGPPRALPPSSPSPRSD